MTGPTTRSYTVNVGVPLAFLVIIALIVGGSFLADRGWEPKPDEVSTTQQEETWRALRNPAADPLTIGDAAAPVELTVLTDYQCPFCSHWSRDTLPALLPYVENEQLRLVFRPVNLSGEGSRTAAKALYAAALQGEIIAMHQALSSDARGMSEEALEEDALVELAAELGLDPARFRADLTAAEVQRNVERKEREGLRLGVSETPSFVFNGEFISGLRPTETFVQNLEATLTE